VDLPRSYYHEFAWAYDLLQTDSVAPRVDFIQAVLSRNEITANSTVLDAGCGTGRYATELAKRGFHVFGVDQSAELIAIARNRESDVVERPQFVIADLLVASFPTLFDAILCRGVLNDFVEDGDRRCIFRRFETWLRPGGILIFDTREWTRTLERYTKGPLHRRTVGLPTGKLEFQSETVLDLESRQLRIREHFNLERNGVQTSSENDFVMRCWTPGEIAIHLSEARLDLMATHSTYGEDDVAWSDRLVVVALKRVPGLQVGSQVRP
jgi:2-polyprenyl-3-methyl-5-hydroxy-6-metoxy-1,4-benzoquinol methylase